MAERQVKLSFDFGRLLATLSREIYDTPLAFLRENVQNAIDAVRMAKVASPSLKGEVHVSLNESVIEISDNGIGMSCEDMERLFWTMGASGKNTELGKQAGCIGTFGIGGFANFGVCDKLMVTSSKLGEPGCSSSLAKADFPEVGVPSVTYSSSDTPAPHGTVVTATLSEPPVKSDLVDYLRSFVQYAQEDVLFDGELLSGKALIPEDLKSRYTALTQQPLVLSIGSEGAVEVQFYRDEGGTVLAHIMGSVSGGELVPCSGLLRLEGASIEVFKRGFKLCNTAVPSTLGVRGRFDADTLQPTAGRDSLSATSQKFVRDVCSSVEKEATSLILDSEELLSANIRIVGELARRGRVEELKKLVVTMADGSKETLGALRVFADSGGKCFYGTRDEKELLQILQEGGNQIVRLSGEHGRRKAEVAYLERFCGAKSYEGLVEIKARYEDLTLFELGFLSYLEMAIRDRYDVVDVKIVAARVTGGVPVYARSQRGKPLELFVDVRHDEVAKLQPLESSPLLYSVVTEFCKTYLGGILKARSPKFFGTGALNFDDILKRTAELWTLAAGDIDVQTWGAPAGPGGSGGTIGVAQVVAASDVREVKVGAEVSEGPEEQEQRPPRVLRVVDHSGTLGLEGYYFRLMDAPAKVFGNDIQAMEERGVFWFGNRITFVFSDLSETAFHYELRLNRLVVTDGDGAESAGGGSSVRLERPIQEYEGGMFLPIPANLEEFLVPQPDAEVVVRVNYEWFDLSGGRVWDARRAEQPGEPKQ